MSNPTIYPSTDGSLKHIPQAAIDEVENIVSNVAYAELSFEDIKRINSNIDLANNGALRSESRAIFKMKGKSPIRTPTLQELESLIPNFMLLIQEKRDPIMVAAVAHLKLIILHPFNDGNGRTAHCLLNLILKYAGYPWVVFENPALYLCAIEQSNNFEYTHDRY